MLTISEAKKQYNKLLQRYKKAEEYFNRDIPQEQKEQFLNNYIEVLNGLSNLLLKIEIYEDEEVLEGFNE